MLTRIASRFPRGRAVLAAVATLAVLTSVADARPGSGGSSGSRGTRTFSAPPTTNTAPKAAAPMEKTITQPSQAKPATVATATAGQAAARPSMMKNLLMGGLIGAGLATLFGAGALSNVLGFLLQGLLIAGLVFLVVNFFRNRAGPRPAMAGAAGGLQSAAAPLNMNRVGPAAGGMSSIVDITGDDYNAFERLLADVQGAYSRGDTATLGRRVTSEMLSYFAKELDDNHRSGVKNVLGAPKLLQGDLSEAWREAGGEYATVAMRYALTDATIEAATGRVVKGSTTQPEEVTEVWTFRRNIGSGPADWELSAIQQA